MSTFDIWEIRDYRDFWLCWSKAGDAKEVFLGLYDKYLSPDPYYVVVHVLQLYLCNVSKKIHISCIFLRNIRIPEILDVL